MPEQGWKPPSPMSQDAASYLAAPRGAPRRWRPGASQSWGGCACLCCRAERGRGRVLRARGKARIREGCRRAQQETVAPGAEGSSSQPSWALPARPGDPANETPAQRPGRGLSVPARSAVQQASPVTGVKSHRPAGSCWQDGLARVGASRCSRRPRGARARLSCACGAGDAAGPCPGLCSLGPVEGSAGTGTSCQGLVRGVTPRECERERARAELCSPAAGGPRLLPRARAVVPGGETPRAEVGCRGPCNLYPPSVQGAVRRQAPGPFPPHMRSALSPGRESPLFPQEFLHALPQAGEPASPPA